MKILHVLAPAPVGGLERVVQALAIGQHRSGHDVAVIALLETSAEDHPFLGPLRAADVRVIPLVAPAGSYLRQWRSVHRVFRAECPDVVHTHAYYGDVVGGSAARSARLATVSTAHGFTLGGWKNRMYESLDRLLLRGMDGVIAVSRPLAEQLAASGVPPQRLHIIANAWSQVTVPVNRKDARQALGLDPAAFVAGWVGRMSWEKGLDVLVDALPDLANTPIVVCAVGDGPERVAQVERAAQTARGARIRWTGLVPDAGRYFAAFDALILSSRSEGVPMVLLDGMAIGIPLVVTAVGGIPDVVSEREALLVPTEQPAALAAALRSIWADSEQAARRAAAAQRRLDQQFSAVPWLAAHDRAYHAVINVHRGGA